MGNYNFKEETGDMQFDASGNLKVNIQAGAGSGGTASVDDAAFTAAVGSGTPMMGFVTADSVDAGDVGVVGMLANRQLKVTLYDSGGTELAVGGGTQYTEDVASAADPVGNQLITRRRDSLSVETTTDGDNTALNSTGKGELYVKHVDSIPITDNGGSLTIDNAALSVVGGGVEATALRVTIASDSTGVLSIDDNGGSITVDGTITANAGTGFPSVQTEDAASAGGETGVMILGVRNDAAASKTSLDGDFSAIATDAAGRVGIADLGGSVSVDDNGGSLTIDNSTLAVVGGGTEATALRVTIASDSTGVLSIDDNGGSLTVDGTVTSNAGTGFPSVQTEDAASAGGETGIMVLGVRNDAAASKTSLDGDFSAIATDAAGRVGISDLGGAISVDDNGSSLTIDNTTLSVVGGGTEATALRVTIATDSTGVLSIDDNGGSLTVDGAVAATIAAGATSFVANEDDASANLDAGAKVLAVRKATPANTSGADGDYEFLQISAGRLWASATIDASLPAGTNAIGKLAANDGVDIGDVTINNASGASAVNIQDGGNSITVDGSVTSADSQTITDNAAFTDGTSKVFMSGYVFDDVAGTALTENDAAAARVDSKRAQVFVLEDATTRGQKQSVSAAGAAHANIAQIGANTVNTGTGASGTGTQRVVTATDSTIGTVTSVTQNADVRQATASNFNAQVVGSIAHDGVDSGNPVKVGMRALAHGTNPTAVAAADRTDWLANRAGIPWVMGGHPNIVTVRANYTAAQTDTAIVTVAAGLKIVVTRVSVTADNANTVDVAVRIGFGTASTPSTTGVVLSHPGIAAGSGVVEGTGSGMIGVGADDEDLRITSEVPTTGSIDVVVTYYTIES